MCDYEGAGHPYTLYGDADEYPAACAAHTPLDPLETSGFGYDNLSQTFRHSGWVKQRRQVWQALQDAEASQNRLGSFATCGATCYIFRSRTDPEVVRLGASTCHDRFCLPCARTRAAIITANILDRLGTAQCRFVTLTLRHDGQPLAARVDRLYDSFKRLRKTDLWKRSQRGGVAFLEIKRSRDRDSWHPHFHVLTHGRFMDGVRLAKTWHEITGDSFIVDIRFVKEIKHVLSYVTKYASKPFDHTLFSSHDTLVEAIKALHGRRLTVTFGNWKGLQTTKKPGEEVWENLGTLEDHLYKAANGDQEARSRVIRCCGQRAKQLIELAKEQLPHTSPKQPHAPPDQQLTFLEQPSYYEQFITHELNA